MTKYKIRIEGKRLNAVLLILYILLMLGTFFVGFSLRMVFEFLL